MLECMISSILVSLSKKGTIRVSVLEACICELSDVGRIETWFSAKEVSCLNY